MEMGEHCTSRGEPADPPISRCERRFHTSFVWWTISCECAGTGWLLLRSAHVAPLDKSAGNPINSLSRPYYRDHPSQNISL